MLHDYNGVGDGVGDGEDRMLKEPTDQGLHSLPFRQRCFCLIPSRFVVVWLEIFGHLVMVQSVACVNLVR